MSPTSWPVCVDRLSKEGGYFMMAPLRCDHCDAVLTEHRTELNRKRFCCVACLRAFERGDMKAISPHVHVRDPARQAVSIS